MSKKEKNRKVIEQAQETRHRLVDEAEQAVREEMLAVVDQYTSGLITVGQLASMARTLERERERVFSTLFTKYVNDHPDVVEALRGYKC